MVIQTIGEPVLRSPAPLAPDEMTLEEFVEKFRKVVPQYVWRERSGYLRGYSNKILAIPLVNIFLQPWMQGMCPITAVARFITGKHYLPGEYYGASRRIGLPPWIAAKIANAADGNPEHKELRELRKQLLDIAGIR